MRCTTIRVSPVPQHELPPTAHPIAKKIAALLQHDGSCCLFGSISEVANFLWQTQEFVFGSQTVQASELIDPDTVTEPQYEGHLTLEDGTEATLVLSDGGQPSLSSCVGLCMKYQSSSDILQGSLSIRMGSVTRTTLSEARWTFVGVDDAAEVASAIEDVYVRCDDTEVALNLDVLKSAHADPAEVSVELHGVTIRFVAQIEVEKMPPPSPRPNMSGEDDCQWRLSIEVRSLKLRVSPAKVFAKYSYPFLEQTRPFRTNPPVMARKNTTIHFPHSFSSYHFPRKKESDIRRAFADMLRIEVWQRETYTADSMVGHAFFDITPIFEQPLKHDSSKPSMGHGYRLLDLISSVEFDNESKGVLRVVVFIENLGVISPPSPPPSARQNLEPTVVTPKELDELRDTPAYSSAVELELWKRNEEAKFRVRLQEEERQKKRQLEEEYEEKERVRSLEFHSQKQQMVKVEQTLRLKLQEVMKREQQLQAVTVKIKTEKAITERQQQITKEQAALETKLLRHEMDQNLKLDHSKCKKLNAKVENIEEDLNLWRQRYTELEEKFIAYRKSVVDSESPIEQLKADIDGAGEGAQNTLRHQCAHTAAVSQWRLGGGSPPVRRWRLSLARRCHSGLSANKKRPRAAA
eukprot:GEMP01012018.1.p1 GENE.GEMP01012018.1~~GEMP01012018.1.p1  ORF type:complete len:634 (+),score=172.55 GEMP01012018.1:36-1937(+)